MGSVKALVILAFAGSIGLLFLVLGCALPQFNNWWPLFVIIFYILAPLPLVIAKRFQDEMASSSAATELAMFLTTGIVISAFALPLILAHSGPPVIQWGAASLTMIGNIVCFLTILAYFYAFRDDDFGYSLW